MSKRHHSHQQDHQVTADVPYGRQATESWQKPSERAPNVATLGQVDTTSHLSTAREERSAHPLSRTDVLDHQGRELVGEPVRFRPQRVEGGPELQLLVNKHYEVGYDNERKNPAWVAYDLDGPIANTAGTGKRPRPFYTDERTEAQVTHQDFSNGQGYNRGHMAPAGIINSRYGREAWLSTFKMSNMTPQNIEMNAGVWNQLEQSIGGNKTDKGGWAESRGKLTVITGPVFDKEGKDETLPSGVAVAKENFMVILDYKEQTDSYDGRAYIIPNKSGISDPDKYLTSIKQVEEKTGLDIFAGEAARYREGLDSLKPSSSWPDLAGGGFNSRESQGAGANQPQHHGGREDQQGHRKGGRRRHS